MTFKIGELNFDLSNENGAIRLKIGDIDCLLSNQTFEEVKDIVTTNFCIVRDHYVKLSNGSILIDDINQISINIVTHYLYMYNLWRSTYKKEKYRNLKWLDKDFGHPDTTDTIINYLKKKYPSQYEEKCQILLEITADELKKHEKNRDEFFNK